MLSYRLLKNHGGIMLIGDHDSLKVLYDVIHDVNDRSPIILDKEGLVLGLAYDVRHAFAGQREVIDPPEHRNEAGIAYGVEILWPVLLVQQRILRQSLAYIDSGKSHQAILYALEWVIESAIKEDFKDGWEEIISLWERIDTVIPFVEENFHGRGAIFCSWTKKERERFLPSLLESLSPMYPFLYRLRMENGEKDLISPELFDSWSDADWPEPNVD